VEDPDTLWVKVWGQIAKVTLPASLAKSSSGHGTGRYDR